MSTTTTENLGPVREPIEAAPAAPTPSDIEAVPTPADIEAAERLRELFARFDATADDEPPGLDAQIMCGIDAERSHRPLFRGMY